MSETDHSRDQRTRLRVATICVVAAFGPYLAAGIRVEQVAVYALTALAVLRFATRQLHRTIVSLAVVWFTILLVAIVSGIAPPSDAEPGSWLSGVDALLLPVATMLLVAALVGSATTAERLELAERVQFALATMLTLNTALSLLMSRVDITGLISGLFWSSGQAADVTATGEYALAVGRITGVFNTPLGAGIAYALGLVAVAHLALKGRLRGWRLLILAVGVLVGGVLCQSKVFLFAGLLAAVGLLVVAGGRQRVKRLAQVAVSGVVAFVLLQSTAWWESTGRFLVERYFIAGDGGALGFYTGGRYGAGAVVSGLRERIEDRALWGGYGATNTLGPLDTGYLDLLARAGLIGVGLGLLFAVGLVVATMRRRDVMPRVSWWALVMLLGVSAAGALGGPSVTQNRAGTLLLLTVFTLLVAWDERIPARPERPATPRSQPARTGSVC